MRKKKEKGIEDKLNAILIRKESSWQNGKKKNPLLACIRARAAVPQPNLVLKKLNLFRSINEIVNALVNIR